MKQISNSHLRWPKGRRSCVKYISKERINNESMPCRFFRRTFNSLIYARIVITHGGPASFIMPLQLGKTPIVVPRQQQFNEHVNNHQVEFARNVAERMGTIIPVEDVDKLKDLIINYDQIVAGMEHEMSSNNAKFNKKLEKIVDELVVR